MGIKFLKDYILTGWCIHDDHLSRVYTIDSKLDIILVVTLKDESSVRMNSEQDSWYPLATTRSYSTLEMFFIDNYTVRFFDDISLSSC